MKSTGIQYMCAILEIGRECKVVLIEETPSSLEQTPAHEISNCHTQNKIPFEFHVLFIQRILKLSFITFDMTD